MLTLSARLGRVLRKSRAASLGVLFMLAGATSASALAAPQIVVDDDGAVHVPAMTVPMSEFLTPEGKAYVTEHLKVKEHPELLVQHDGVPVFLEKYIERQKAEFPTVREDTKVGGVHAYVYTPKAGIAPTNEKRVLINLHGGGFSGCWPGCAELESMPISALARIKVVSVDYREGPKYRHPAASEDVASVYKELLKTYRPENIGIYGCSAGGMLSGMAVAWFQKVGLPRPGAIGIFCSGLVMKNGMPGGGDSMYTVMPVGEAALSLGPSGEPGNQKVPENYFTGSDTNDPLISPANSLSVLAKFPPTLMVTGTRGMELSGAVYTHSRLVKAGVDAQLNVWEGMFHGFFYNPDVPESRDCYDVIVKFFDRYLGK